MVISQATSTISTTAVKIARKTSSVTWAIGDIVVDSVAAVSVFTSDIVVGSQGYDGRL
jgi:hypothetical protein